MIVSNIIKFDQGWWRKPIYLILLKDKITDDLINKLEGLPSNVIIMHEERNTMQRTETICDRCGARKGEFNDWWIGGVSRIGFHIYPSNNANDHDLGLGEKRDYCSDNCVMKALSEFMTSCRISVADKSELEEVAKEFEHSYDKEFDK